MDIARILGVGRSSVYTWAKLEREHGPEALAATPHTGPSPALSDEQLRELEGLLRLGPRHHGWRTDLWTAKRVTELIERRFGVRFHVEHVRKLLKRKLGRSSQKPQKRARERDEAAIGR